MQPPDHAQNEASGADLAQAIPSEVLARTIAEAQYILQLFNE